MRRRDFVTQVAVAGGSAYSVMAALQLLAPERTNAATLDIEGSGHGTTVAILGAGVAGMCAAYELGKHGYDCHILEARSRPGGRAWTIRAGTTETEIGGPPQTSTFSTGLYWNPGPGRVSHHHVTMDYYRELKIAIQPFVNDNFNAYYYNSTMNGGLRVRSRQARFDMLGYTSELLAKAISHDSLDAQMTKDDKDALLTYLRASGNLDPNMIYKGSGQAGYSTEPGACDAPGTPLDPLGLVPLIRSRFGMNSIFTSDYDQQPTMFQPVGGMDALPMAFAKQLGDRISYNTEVREIRRTSNGVRIVYRDQSGNEKSAEARYCICTIPLSVLKRIPSDFSTRLKTAINAIPYAKTMKIGLEFKRRFWEEDDRIYGGISNTNDDITQIWYPNYDFFSSNGILTAAYAFEKPATRLGALTPADRIKAALEQGGKIHAQYPSEYANGFSVAWHRVPYTEGGWGEYSDEMRKTYFPTLCEGEGPFYLAGEHISYLAGWQAGALESARSVVTRLHARVRATA
ncbi:MAG TPA: flavin monoamine oxidase family protein [Candidatus Acidoferrales bacterium]|nr:flavin monoamine oxidase family protein [Candidatus Acidoferrales bacterium]